MAYIEPKTDWKYTDGVTNDDLNRIEGNIKVVGDKVTTNTLTPITTDTAITKLDNCEDAFAQNLIIKGKTLQNLWDNSRTITTVDSSLVQQCYSDFSSRFNTRGGIYTFVNVSNKYIYLDLSVENTTNYSRTIPLSPNAKKIVTLNSDFPRFLKGSFAEGWENTNSSKNEFSKSLMILEGQPKEIPQYFEGIQSSGEAEGNKLSILTKGKNLVNSNNLNMIIKPNIDKATDYISCFIPRGVNYTFGIFTEKKLFKSSDSSVFTLHLFDENKNKLDYWSATGSGNRYIETPMIKDCYFVQLTCIKNSKIDTVIDGIKVSIGNTVSDETWSDYQEDKTEILLPSPHAGLPNETADIIDVNKNIRIKNIDKVILNGSEGWSTSSWFTTNYIRFYHRHNLAKYNTAIVSEKFYWLKTPEEYRDDITAGIFTDNDFNFKILKSQLETPDLAGFKKWLQDNPTTVYYQLANPVSEPLKITGQLQTFKDGYVQLPNAITPYVSLDYSTNLPSAIGELTRVTDGLVDTVGGIISKEGLPVFANTVEPSTDGVWMNMSTDIAETGSTSIRDALFAYATQQVGDLNALTTSVKNNAVVAINELDGRIDNIDGSILLSDADTLPEFNKVFIQRSGPDTLNTPYKQGLTNATASEIFTFCSSANNGIQISLTSGSFLFMRRLAGGSWLSWVKITTNDDTGWVDVSSTYNSKVTGSLLVRRIWNQVFVAIGFKGQIINENETIATIPVAYAPKGRGEFFVGKFTAGLITVGLKTDGVLFLDYINTGNYTTNSFISMTFSYLID